MDLNSIETLITSTLTDFGASVLVILTAVIGLAIAYVAFRFGFNKLLFDQSLMVGGFYLRKTPYKGYNRFRSKQWNMKNTM